MRSDTPQEGFGFLKTRYTAPAAPFQPTSDTSVDAAEKIEGHISKQEGQVLAVYRSRRNFGATMEEVEQATGLKSGSVCARTNALSNPNREGGALLVKTERVRITNSGRFAAVYITPEFDR